ncbi:MAG: divergent polysaccharide deacetylase family protein [Rhodobacter sp.]|nr:divergent polysaccharide deacetylase family protein [Rhodobacter sp.]
MGRGFLSGIVWGVIVAALGLGVASQFAGRVDLTSPEPEVAAVAVPPGSEFNRERPETQPALPQNEGRPAATEPPQVPAVEPGALSPPVADTEPAAEPETGQPEAMALPVPETGAPPQVSAGPEEAVLPAPSATRPPEPAPDIAPIADTPEGPEAAAPDLPAGDAAGIGAAPAPDVPPSTLPGDFVGLRLPVPEIEDMAPGVTTDRLPSIGAQPEAEAAAEPALQAFAVPFEAEADASLMAVVLLDPGPEREDPAVLAEFPVPISVAVDATGADAAEAAAAYRAAGLEVVALTPLPPGAAPADVEVAFQEYLSSVPESVAVLDVPEALLQANRPRAVQVADILAASGHGMVTYDKSLNAGLQIAEAAGVKAVTVFREFDDGAQDATTIKRFLDQGAFRAGQDAGVVMVGTLRPETLSALAEWALGTRAETISLAPISALLSRQ